jgi:NAD(P)-dependent dehydrogenase (short-subunit alcohol dehydrogenase family)
MTAAYPFAVDAREFSGKRVLITGGTKGLGAAMVHRFLLSGARVASTARSPANRDPAPTIFIQADVSTPAGVQAVTDRILNEWGGLDILVDNVGASDVPPVPLESLTDERWLEILNINFMSAIRLDRAFLKGMIERKQGVVIHIGSIWHRLVQTDSSLAYCAAKGALSSYSKGLARALAPKGVRVNMVSPGCIETEAAYGWITHIATSEGISEDAARLQFIAAVGGIPVGRTGKPAEIAELVAFLASDRGSFASGVDYFLDGGAFPTV